MNCRMLATAVFAAALVAGVARADEPEKSELTGEHEREIFSLAWSPDGTMLASSGDDSAIVVWDVKSESKKFRLDGREGSVCSVAWSATLSFS